MMKVYKVNYKAKSENLEFEDSLLITGTGKKDAKARFQGMIDRAVGLKGKLGTMDIMYDLSCTEISITDAEEVEKYE